MSINDALLDEAEKYLQKTYGTYRGHPEWRALKDAFIAGAALAAIKPEPQAQAAELWVGRWYGSGKELGWWIVCGRDHIVHLGADVLGDGKKVRKIVDAHNLSIAKLYAALDACVESEKGEHCPACPDQGWYVVADNRGEAQQEQCEFCYTNPRSIFNLRRAAITQAQEARK